MPFSKSNNVVKRIFITSIIFSLFFFSTPQKTQAQYVDVIQAPKELALDTIAVTVAKIVIKKLAAKTVNWINSGFKGNPAYVTDPGQFFLDVGDDVASRYLSETQLNKLCSPFKAEVRLALVKNYISDDDNFACTLNTLKNNYEQFTQDFNQGGWDGWFEMTQNSQNNPFGAYLNAKNQLAVQVGTEKDKYKKQLEQGNGFLSYEKCDESETVTAANRAQWSAEFQRNFEIGDCAGTPKTVTPGSVINDQLGNALGTGFRQLEAADEINEIVTALVTQLIERVVGGIGNGLRGASKPATPGGRSFTEELSEEEQPTPYNLNDLRITQGELVCETTGGSVDSEGNVEMGTQTCRVVPPEISGPPWIITPTPGGGRACIDPGHSYADDLLSAMETVLDNDPDLAGARNSEENGFRLMELTAEQLNSSGLQAAADVTNGNNNPSRGDIIAVWRSGDVTMERYDAIRSSGNNRAPLSDYITAQFAGHIPLDCTAGGGGRNCGCATSASGPLPPVPNATTTPKFWLLASYLDAFDATNLTYDLDYLKSKGIEGIRISPMWWNWAEINNDTAKFSPRAIMDTNGNINPPALLKLRQIIDAANARQMIVDISFSRNMIPGTCMKRDDRVPKDYFMICEEAYKTGVVSVVTALLPYRNIFYTLQNQADGYDSQTHFELSHIRNLADRIRATGNTSPLSVSFGLNRTDATAGADAIGGNIIQWHIPEGNDMGTYLRSISRSFEAVKPTYVSDPYPYNFPRTVTNPQELIDRAKAAKSYGLSGFIFHTQAGFDLDTGTFESKLTNTERLFLNSLVNELRSVDWGTGRTP